MNRHVLVNIVAIVVVLLLTAGGIIAFVVTLKEPEIKPRREAVRIVVAPPIRARLNHRVLIKGTGSARPKVQLDISPLVAGKVVEKADNYLSGKAVRAGQMLFKIEKTDYAQALAAAKGRVAQLAAQLAQIEQERANLNALEKIETDRLAIARQTYEKARKLLGRGAGSQSEVDNAQEVMLARKLQLQNVINQTALIAPRLAQLQAERTLATVEQDKAQTALDRTTVTSPVTGLVLNCKVEVGEHVQAGGVCGEVYGTDVMEVPVAVPASDLQWIDPTALKALIGSSNGADDRLNAAVASRRGKDEQPLIWSGTVDRLEAGLEAQTRTATLVVQVTSASLPGRDPDAPRRTLDRNRFCDVTIDGRVVPRAFILPRRAVQPDGTVFLANDGKLTRRAVTVARWTDNEVMILPGGEIKEGDRVVTKNIPPLPVLNMPVKAVDALPSPTTAPAMRAAR